MTTGNPSRDSRPWTAHLDLFLKILSGAVALAAFLWGVHTYQITSQRTAAAPFYDKQLKLYFAASEAAATLASSSEPLAWRAARDKFWMLYWGPLSMVEDISARATTHPLSPSEPPTVEEAMKLFGGYLLAVEANLPPSGIPTDQQRETLQPRSYWLAHRLRDSMRASWPIHGDSPRPTSP